ncbi:MAG: hypothetical protein WDN49_27720 [Acetobacteraceae bacterium]
MTELPDRTVWEGKLDCGLKVGIADLVIYKPVRDAHDAVVIIRPDDQARSPQPIGQSVFHYQLAHDTTLDLFRLSAPSTLYLSSTLQPEPQVEFALEGGDETLHGKLGSSCNALTLSHRRYPQPTADLLAAVKADPAKPPPTTMATPDPLSSCVVLSAWAAHLRASMPDVDPKRLSMAGP